LRNKNKQNLVDVRGGGVEAREKKKKGGGNYREATYAHGFTFALGSKTAAKRKRGEKL